MMCRFTVINYWVNDCCKYMWILCFIMYVARYISHGLGKCMKSSVAWWHCHKIFIIMFTYDFSGLTPKILYESSLTAAILRWLCHKYYKWQLACELV